MSLQHTCLAPTSPPLATPAHPSSYSCWPMEKLAHDGQVAMGGEGVSGLEGTLMFLQEVASPQACPAWLRGWMRPVSHIHRPIYLMNSLTGDSSEARMFSQSWTQKSYSYGERGLRQMRVLRRGFNGRSWVVVWLTVISQCSCVGFDLPK